jgi:hypothetical protein
LAPFIKFPYLVLAHAITFYFSHFSLDVKRAYSYVFFA